MGKLRIVKETGRPVAHVARELGVNGGTLGNWVRRDASEQAGRADRGRASRPRPVLQAGRGIGDGA